MNNLSPIGIHLPLSSGLRSLVDQARLLNIPYFQFFLTHNNRYLHIPRDDIAYFLRFRNHFSTLFIHSSYWINPSSSLNESRRISERFMLRELHYAYQLKVSHIVLHAGTANGYEANPRAKIIAIDALARFFNYFLKKNKKITFLLENTAHGGNSIGSNLEDFQRLKTKIDYPENLGFCLDTAHAFAYGYELTQPDAFLNYFDTIIGLESLKLIHLNDLNGKIGKKHDHHAVPGQGKIGLLLLKTFAQHPLLAHIPKIIEYPASIYVENWHLSHIIMQNCELFY